MHSKKISPTDMGKSHKRKHRSVGPNVTINNIVTLDPEKYTRSSSTSKLSPETDYDRAKFIVEERARYWRDLKILYNDYTLVKLKQKELIDSEDNYVNKHCIEETIKLSNTLKLKIQAKCKDIIFITNLCGDSEVNRVVQSLADGENIDSVLIKKQRSLSETRQAEERVRKRKASLSKTIMKTAKKTDDKDKEEEEEVDIKEVPVSSVPPKRKPSVNEPKFLDSELHWCQYCNVFPPTIKKYLQHLHEESHKKKIKELKINGQPWHKCLPEEQAWRTDSTDTVHVKAFNFFVPANGWFCQLCRSWMGDIHCAATHLRSYVHNMNLKNFQEKFPRWKQGWLNERTKALEETFKVRKESSVDNVQQKKKQGNNNEESDSSDEEQSPSEPISRHRTSKSKMWVPNPKAFERVCNETNPPPATTATESSLTKLKLPKKDRPPFIGKMPLISSIHKKIVVKELPQNTTEKIATSCAESDKLQKEQDALKEIIIRRNEEENELKLKEFMKVANKIKKGSKKKKTDFETVMAAESYNATEFVPVVEHVDPIENLIGPPALVAQWEAEANYDYHMRQFLHYNMTSQMMQMQQPQTFLLDPYHAVALHNQQYFNSTNMISNQYENFELISRDDEEVYSQYMDFQNSPSSSPCTKMFASSSKSTTDGTHITKRGKDKKKQKVTEQSREHETESSDKSKPKQSVVKDSIGKERRPPLIKDKTRLEAKLTPKPRASHVIQKPACLNTPLASVASNLMPSFKETFLSNNDNVVASSGGFISSLLTSSADVKIVSTNELYKTKKKFSSQRRKLKKLNYKNKISSQASAEQPSNASNNTETSMKTDNIEMKNPREKTNYDANMQRPSESVKPTSPKKNQTASQSLQDKINSIRKGINKNKQVDNNETDLPAKLARREENISESITTATSNNVRIQGNERHRGRDEGNRLCRDEEEESEEDGDVEKLIYYDMSNI